MHVNFSTPHNRIKRAGRRHDSPTPAPNYLRTSHDHRNPIHHFEHANAFPDNYPSIVPDYPRTVPDLRSTSHDHLDDATAFHNHASLADHSSTTLDHFKSAAAFHVHSFTFPSCSVTASDHPRVAPDNAEDATAFH